MRWFRFVLAAWVGAAIGRFVRWQERNDRPNGKGWMHE